MKLSKNFFLETSMRDSDFAFTCVDLLHFKCQKMNFQCSRSNIDSPDWIKSKKATINPINDDDKCFEYAATVALNHEEIGKNSQRILKIKPFINEFIWKGINYPARKQDWKKVLEKFLWVFNVYDMDI